MMVSSLYKTIYHYVCFMRLWQSEILSFYNGNFLVIVELIQNVIFLIKQIAKYRLNRHTNSSLA